LRIAFAPSGEFAYVTNALSDDVSVIRMSDLTEITRISVGDGPIGIAVSPNGEFAYVTNQSSNTVSIIRLLLQPSPENFPTAPVQQFGVPAGSTVSDCAALAPDHVSEPGIASLREVGWSLSWAEWVDNGAGGPICSRQPYFTGSAWAVR
jgi:YVTN family beta-propeller protein